MEMCLLSWIMPPEDILIDVKFFSITTVDVYEYIPLLIFNAVVLFPDESLHRKCVKKEGNLGLKHMLGFLLAGNKCPNVTVDKLTHMLEHVLTHTLKSGSNLVTQWHTEPNTKHMSKFGVITTVEWYNIVSFNLI